MSAKKKILVVDDEVKLTQLIKSILEASGRFEVREANGGMQGLQTARLWRPDLVLLDIMMPDVDGADVAQQIREDATLSATRIVFLTAAVTKAEASSEHGVIGGHPFLAKPVTVQELLRCLDQQLSAGTAG